MAKKFTAGHSKCNKCKADAQGSMYRTNDEHEYEM